MADRKQASAVHGSTRASRSAGSSEACCGWRRYLGSPSCSGTSSSSSSLPLYSYSVSSERQGREEWESSGACVDKRSQSRDNQHQDATCENDMRKAADFPSKGGNPEPATRPTEGLIKSMRGSSVRVHTRKRTQQHQRIHTQKQHYTDKEKQTIDNR